jgi:hypothetical protein
MTGVAQGLRQAGMSTLLGVVMVTIAAPSWAVTRHVRNWGVDSPTCGTTAAPCRSIGEALSLAVSGDTVLVGPGRYSNDLDGDSVYNEAGEEPSTGLVIGDGVTVKSTHGAAATRIEYSGTALIVVSGGNGAIFGKRNHGFTCVAANIVAGISFPSGGSVSGNVLFVESSSFPLYGIIVFGGAVARDNRIAALSSLDPFSVGIQSDGVVERNVVIGFPFGFQSSGTLRRNVAIENRIGFYLVNPSVAEFTKNIAVANSHYGVYLASLATVTGPFQKNTIVGNDVGTNCGLYNNSGTAVTATKNFWGPGGPGADPADNVCNGAGSSTTTTPFLAAPAAPGPGAVQ